MFDIGFSELVLIAVLALIVLGPKRLPEMARTAGQWMAKLRRFVSEVKHDIDREMRNAEIMDLQKLKQELDETRRLMQDTSGRMMQQIGAESNDQTSMNKIVSSPVTAAVKRRTKKTSVTKRSHGQARTAKKTRRV